MVSLDFEKGKLLPSLTLVELGNQAYARGESGGGDCYQSMVICNGHYTVYHCDGQYTSEKCSTYEVGCYNCD